LARAIHWPTLRANPRQPVRPEHEQAEHEDDYELPESDIEHGRAPERDEAGLLSGVRLLPVAIDGRAAVVPLRLDLGAGTGSSDWGSSMDLRKALIAAPRSPPMVRTFLVPKTIMTTSNTINQCQILMLPIGGLLRGNALPAPRG
jgi:hypothetical protein